MDSIDAWCTWFEANLPTKVSADARLKYSSLLIENEIFDLETFSECIDIESDFLSAKINVKNVALQNSIKRLVQAGSASTSPLPTQLHTALSSTSLLDFEPVTNIGSELSPAYWKIDNVVKLDFASRCIYSGSFTVANVTREVFIKRQTTDRVGDNDLEHEASVYKAIRFNNSLIELLYYHPVIPNSYLVLEKFGRNLNAFLHNKCAIRLQILEELGIALKALHGAGYVHCDVKPQNILVDSHEGTVRLKLCDLDSAERVGELFQHVDGALKYTEQWVAPEVYFGRGGELRVSPAIDVFSYGLIAAVLFDDAISTHKTILPRKDDNVSYFEKCLTDQATLDVLMPCQRGKRYEELVHKMCSLRPAHRATLQDVDLALGLSRATAIHAHNAALARDNDFLKHEVVDKQGEIIQHLQDIKQTLAEMGAKLTLLLQNDVELKNMVGTVLNGSFDCPTLFIYVPVAANKSIWSRAKDPLSFVQDRFKLFFMCAQTMEMVPCGPDGNGYAVSCNKAWLVKAAPYIKVGLLLLKEVMATYHLPLPIASTLNMLASDAHLHAKFIDGALNYVTSSCRASALGKVHSEFDSVVACLDATDRVTELKSVDRSPTAAKEAYNSVKSVLTGHNYWNNISTTCGLVLASHKGEQAWIKADKIVKAKFVEQVEKNIHATIHVSLPVPPPENQKVVVTTPAASAPSSQPAANNNTSTTVATNEDSDDGLFSKAELAQIEATKEKERNADMAKYSSLFDDDDDDASAAVSAPPAPSHDVDVPAATTSSVDATDEEVHELSLRCRLSGAESQTARLKQLSDTGHWYAELCYARLCDIGAPLVPKDPSVVKAYLDKDPTALLLAMAKSNNRYAQFALGYVYSEKGALYNATEAVRYSQLAAEQGHPFAQRYLYLCYFNGYHGLAVDKKVALKWLRLSSDQGYAASQYSLAQNYTKGKCGLPKDPEEGVRLFKLAAAQGFADAEFSLAQAYFKGEGGLSKNDTKAVKYYERAAAQGNASAQFCLANAYANNTDGIKKKKLSDEDRIATADGIYLAAAKLGHVKAMVKAGHFYLKQKQLSDQIMEWSQIEGGKKEDIVKTARKAAKEEKQASEWFLLAAEEGNAEGQYHCAMLSRHLDEKLKWLNEAAQQGYADAYFQLGNCHQHGVGVAVNKEEATKWYQKKVDAEIANGESGKGAAADCIKEMNKKGGLFGFFK